MLIYLHHNSSRSLLVIIMDTQIFRNWIAGYASSKPTLREQRLVNLSCKLNCPIRHCCDGSPSEPFILRAERVVVQDLLLIDKLLISEWWGRKFDAQFIGVVSRSVICIACGPELYTIHSFVKSYMLPSCCIGKCS